MSSKMRIISSHQAEALLSTVRMRLGSWNNLESMAPRLRNRSAWEKLHAPSSNLLSFSHHVAAWLPRGKWKLVQFDDSNGWMDPVQVSLIGSILNGSKESFDFNVNQDKTFLFEFEEGPAVSQELQIGNLVYFMLLFELHMYVASAASSAGEMLAVQDGFVYFCSDEKGIARSRSIMKTFARNPSAYPNWIAEFVAAKQDLQAADRFTE